jgi:hypothetical protein
MDDSGEADRDRLAEMFEAAAAWLELAADGMRATAAEKDEWTRADVDEVMQALVTLVSAEDDEPPVAGVRPMEIQLEDQAARILASHNSLSGTTDPQHLPSVARWITKTAAAVRNVQPGGADGD